MKNIRNITVTLLLFAIGCGAVYTLYLQQVYGLWTRDGRVRSDVITLASEVQGYVEHTYVQDNQQVKKGQLMFAIDDRDYKIRAAQTYQAMQAQKINVARLKKMYDRRRNLSGSALSKEEVDNAGLDYTAALAQYAEAVENNRQAELNLSKTKIVAPADGYISNLQIHPGDYLSAGKNIVSIVKKDAFYVYAYFQEDQIQRVHPGQRAKIILLNSKSVYAGSVESISRGISDSSDKSGTGELHDVNPTFEWVRLPMRIPVRIAISPNVKHYDTLISGMTCTVELAE